MFILGEVVQYILVVLVFLGLAISRLKRRRDARKAASKSAKEAMEEKMLELEIAAQMGELEENLVIETPETMNMVYFGADQETGLFAGQGYLLGEPHLVNRGDSFEVHQDENPASISFTVKMIGSFEEKMELIMDTISLSGGC